MENLYLFIVIWVFFQYLMLMYSVCPIRHKLTVTYVTTLDAVTFVIPCGCCKKANNHPNLHQ